MPGRRAQIGAGVIGAAAAATAVILPTTMTNEGFRSHVYLDPARIPTYCFGDTKDPKWGHTYSRSECAQLLKTRMVRDYAVPITNCVPQLADPRHLHQFAASIDAAYNAGTAAFCRSPMAASFRAGDWKGGCLKFVGWYATAELPRPNGLSCRLLNNGKWSCELPGLVRRRQEESAACLKEDR